jgi:hypothetical protein
MSLRRTLPLALVVLGMLLGGCGGDKDQNSSPTYLTADAEGRIVIEDFQDAEPGEGLPQAWENLVFSEEHGHTEYRVVSRDGNHFLRAHAKDASSAIMRPATVDLDATPVLSWRWRVSGVPEGADPRHKKTEDTAGRVFVMFDYKGGRLGTGMETLYYLASLRYGEYPPLYSLVYIWATDMEPGTVFTSPYTDQAKIFVVESGEQKAGQWVTERRNVREDFRRAFGDVAPTPMEGIGLITDTDDLHGEVTADYDDFMFLAPGAHPDMEE